MSPIYSRLSCLFLTAAMVATIAGANLGEIAQAIGNEPKKQEEKRVTIEFKDAPWAKVLEWYSDQAEMPLVVGKHRVPAGTFTYSTPKGQTHTVTEVLFIINDALVQQEYVLVRRRATLTLFKIAK
ncbi:MAG: hypothetical protein EXR98_17420 [Gemmataceae bacterium]|nr:hypothetical protein [Gemmataceae bacterium]